MNANNKCGKTKEEKQFKCPLCERGYSSKVTLSRHLAVKHPEEKKAVWASLSNPSDSKGRKGRPRKRESPCMRNMDQFYLMSLASYFVYNVSTFAKDDIQLEFDSDPNRERILAQQVQKLRVSFELSSSHDFFGESIADRFFKFENYSLNLKRQISKHFKIPFAAKVVLTIDIFEQLLMSKDADSATILRKLWGQNLTTPCEINKIYEKWKEKVPNGGIGSRLKLIWEQ